MRSAGKTAIALCLFAGVAWGQQGAVGGDGGTTMVATRAAPSIRL